MTTPDENRKSASVFDSSKLSAKNKYEVFFGGNFPQIRIDTAAPTDRALMVVKDSYANCLIPMLTPYFRTIVVIDPRYFTGDLEVTLAAEGVNEILLLYNAGTLAGDTALRADLR